MRQQQIGILLFVEIFSDSSSVDRAECNFTTRKEKKKKKSVHRRRQQPIARTARRGPSAKVSRGHRCAEPEAELNLTMPFGQIQRLFMFNRETSS